MNKLILFCAVLIFAACGNAGNTEIIEVKNDAGVVVEKYTRDKTDYAKEGLYQAFDSQGKLIEEANYVNDTLHGQRTVYFSNGKPEAVENYEKGLFEGEWNGYTKEGGLDMQGNYVNNEMVGVWKRFYPDGQVKEEVTFADNNENGPFVEYYADGNLKAEGNYLNGDFEHGELKLYNEHGELERRMDCVKGRCSTVWRSEKLIKEEAAAEEGGE